MELLDAIVEEIVIVIRELLQLKSAQQLTQESGNLETEAVGTFETPRNSDIIDPVLSLEAIKTSTDVGGIETNTTFVNNDNIEVTKTVNNESIKTLENTKTTGNLHSDRSQIERVVKRLINIMPTIKTSYARSSIIWLVTQNISLLKSIAPDFLRICIKGFINDVESLNLNLN